MLKHPIYVILILFSFQLRAQKVGIGTSFPNENLHIHEANLFESTGLQLTNIFTGASSNDGLFLINHSLNGSLLLRESGTLSLGTNNLNHLNILSDGRMGLNTTDIIGFSDFTLNSHNASGLGGMYINSPGAFNGSPAYGYSTGGISKAYHYYDAQNSSWKLNVSGNKMVVNSNGNVGIGTQDPSPSAVLDLSSISRGFLPPRMTSTNRMNIGNPIAGLMVYDTTASDLYAYDGTQWYNTSEKLWQSTAFGISNISASVGIGSDPTISSKLAIEVDANNITSIGARIINKYEGSGQKFGIKINSEAQGTGVNYGVQAEAVANASDSSPAFGLYGIGDLNTSNADVYGVYGVATGSGAGVMHGVYGLANGSGYAIYGKAIGSTTAAGFFEGKVIADGTGQSDATLHLLKTGADASYSSPGILQLGPSDNPNIVMDDNEILSRNNGDPSQIFIQRDAGDILLCALENGQVGIGLTDSTSLPDDQYLLAVDGKIICEEMRVELSGSWPDYVFDDQYRLLPISQLSDFINQHHHLPGIKPASEIETTGLDLGEMQKKMMEKIEELTLYIIQLNEKNELLSEELLLLKNKATHK